jgi:hypothetical protein
MNTPVMMERIAEASPHPGAGITGVVYLLYFLTAVLGEFFCTRRSQTICPPTF